MEDKGKEKTWVWWLREACGQSKTSLGFIVRAGEEAGGGEQGKKSSVHTMRSRVLKRSRSHEVRKLEKRKRFNSFHKGYTRGNINI